MIVDVRRSVQRIFVDVSGSVASVRVIVGKSAILVGLGGQIMADQKKESKALPKQSLMTGVVNSVQKNLAAPQQVQNPTTQRTSAPTRSVVAPNYSKSREPQRRDL